MSTDLHLLRARRAETLANLEDLAPFKDSKFPEERHLWKRAKRAYQVASEEYRLATANIEKVQ